MFTAAALIRRRMQDVAKEQALPTSLSAPTMSSSEHGVFPQGAGDSNPYNKIPGFQLHQPAAGGIFFQVVAWPMMEWVLDSTTAIFSMGSAGEHSVIVLGAMGLPRRRRGTGGASPSRSATEPAQCGSPHYDAILNFRGERPQDLVPVAGLRCCKVCTILAIWAPSWCEPCSACRRHRVNLLVRCVCALLAGAACTAHRSAGLSAAGTQPA